MSHELTGEQSHFLEIGKLIRAMKEKFGEEAYQVAEKYFGELALSRWKEKAEKSESNSIESLVEQLCEPLRSWEPVPGSTFDYKAEKTESGVQLKCTRCNCYDLAKYLGITEEAYYIFCITDPYIVKGFNPDIGFKRTKTLMQGDDYCDHCYYYKNKE